MKREKLRTQVSKVTTLGRSSVEMDCAYAMTQDVPSGERIGALEIQLDTFLHEALPVAPLVHPVFEMGVQDLHGYSDEIVVTPNPSYIGSEPTVSDENAALRVSVIRQLQPRTTKRYADIRRVADVL